jgi:polyisoprenoid-binding protein YceI
MSSPRGFVGEDFFAVDIYPEAKISLNKMYLDEKPDNYIVEGDLTIKNITNAVIFVAKIAKEGEGLRITSEFEIDRALWGITWGDGGAVDSLKDKYLKDKIRFNLNILTKI